MVSRTAGEDCRLGNGDYLAWESSQWNLKGKAKFASPVTAEDLCRRVSKIQLFTAPTQFDQCVDHCEKIQGGRLPTVRSLSEQQALYGRVDEVLYVNEAKQKESGMMSFAAWVPINQINGTWVDLYNKKPMADLIWAKGNPTPESCALYIIPWKGLGSYACKVQIKVVFLFCPCHFPDSPRLTLRGLCPDSNLDQSYVPRNDPVTGWVYYYGTFKTIAKLDGLEGKWEMQSAFFNTTASTDAKPGTFILGKHSWNIGGDSRGCHSGQPYTTKLKLTGCTEGDFTCDDGQCVRMEERCNQVPDCRDESDENGCQLVAFKNNYKKEIPPIGRAKDGRAIPANVDISITLMKVVDIAEVAHSIHLQFQISLAWRENRVQYQNLKEDTTLNALSTSDVNSVWLPLVIYSNTDQKEVTRLGEYGNGEWITTVAVTREEANPERSGLEVIDETEYFQGAKNTLTMNQTYTWAFQCNYALQNYPFDTQVFDNNILRFHFIIWP